MILTGFNIMPKLIFITSDKQEYAVEAQSGVSAMEAALDNLVPGIDGDCGGVAACGTCHVYVDQTWLAKTGGAQEGIEQDMLSLTDNSGASSRLSCQIVMSDELDGLVLTMPESQH
jgi:2Fe-2S ferredoxin